MVITLSADTIRAIPLYPFRLWSCHVARAVLIMLLFVQSFTSINGLSGMLNCQCASLSSSGSNYSDGHSPKTSLCAFDTHASEFPAPFDAAHHLLHHAHQAFALAAGVAPLTLLLLVLRLWITGSAMPLQLGMAPIPHPPQYR
jgi:hypothetical protein